MKQVQANLYEALYAREANRTLMVFTIVTVVFVRLLLEPYFKSIYITDWLYSSLLFETFAYLIIQSIVSSLILQFYFRR
jgi:uncharacterized membrane protein YoaK (UPF0700 family)